MLNIILILLGAYLIGAIPFSFVVAKFKGVDLRKVGSGNIGATNVYRTVGVVPGVIAFLCDSGKGYVAVMLANMISNGDAAVTVLGAAFVVIGHTFSPFMKFKGGKGVAAGVGVLFYLQPVVALIGLLSEIVIVAATRYVSLASILSGILVFVLMLFPTLNAEPAYTWFVLIIVSYIIYKHRSNIKRLINGEENKI